MEPAVVTKVIKAFATYVHNTDPDVLVKAIFPDAHETYIHEKVQYITKRSITYFLGTLNTENFEKFCYNVTAYANSQGIF